MVCLRFRFLVFILIFSFCAFSEILANPVVVNKPFQFIAISFDGSKSISMWEKTRQLAKETGARLTYFVSGVYMLTDNNKALYREPRLGSARSAIGWGGTNSEVEQRAQQMLMAFQEGNEIPSHGNGHFDGGSRWKAQQWQSEFNQFHEFLYGLYINNKIAVSLYESQAWRSFLDLSLVGYRAPLLEVNDFTYQTLAQPKWEIKGHVYPQRYVYDASRIAGPQYWPTRNQQGLWNFPLASLQIRGRGTRTLSMDYNFYVAHSKGLPDPANADRYEQEMYQTYMHWFETSFNASRAPMNIGHHFSNWNNGAYYRALYRFAKEVCQRPQVICGTYQELMLFLNEKSTLSYLAPKEEPAKSFKGGWKASSAAEDQSLMSVQEIKAKYPSDPALWGDYPEAHTEVE